MTQELLIFNAAVFELHPRRLVVGILLVAALFNATCHIEVAVMPCYDMGGSLRSGQIQATWLRQHDKYIFFYKLLATGLLVTFGPFLLILVISLYTGVSLGRPATGHSMITAAVSSYSSQSASFVIARNAVMFSNLREQQQLLDGRVVGGELRMTPSFGCRRRPRRTWWARWWRPLAG